jgi:DNA-binding transcriptional LysR family regulator
MTTNIGWELYRSFLSVLKEGSLSGAARVLGITQPTVGRHIAALEQALGVALFTRSQLGLTPTETALGLRTYAETMESTAASLERAATASGEGVSGVVRVAASEVVGVEVLPPIIEQLRRQHPELKVELVLSNRVQDLLRREADIAVRMMRPEQEQLVARRVGNIEVGLFARKDYLARQGMPRRFSELTGHSLIGFDQASAFIRKASRSFQGFNREAFSIRTDSDLAQLALIRSGAGIGGCQAPLAERDDTLTRVLPTEFSLQLETWVTMHEDLRTSPRCRVTFDVLIDGLARYIA